MLGYIHKLFSDLLSTPNLNLCSREIIDHFGGLLPGFFRLSKHNSYFGKCGTLLAMPLITEQFEHIGIEVLKKPILKILKKY